MRTAYDNAGQKDDRKANDKRIIQSVERVVSILDYLAKKPRGERLSVIARELGLNKRTAFGLVSSLEALDLLSQDEKTGAVLWGSSACTTARPTIRHNILTPDISRPFHSLLSAAGGPSGPPAAILFSDSKDHLLSRWSSRFI
ncbi:MAG: helix-turn-helix domain-containing protein [Clostridia bacterium]|nr:helix-turn-helix domain-containing protein [Clostridia bacterium]